MNCLTAKTDGCLIMCCVPSNAIAGETALDRLANALGGKAVLPHVVKLVPPMLLASKPLHQLLYRTVYTILPFLSL